MYQLGIYIKGSNTPVIKEYDDYHMARMAGAKAINRTFDNWLYEISDNGKVIFAAIYNYDSPLVIRDLKSYACCCRNEIGRGEMEYEAFLWFKHYGYIVFHSKSIGVEGGLWSLTQRFRNVGIAVHNGCLPPEFD